MKSFKKYLSESIRYYTYKVKLNFKPSEEVMNKIEQALARYELIEITSVKSLPIQRVDRDFPGINNPETYTFDVKVAYPATTENIRHTLSLLGFALENVVVLNAEHDESVNIENDKVEANHKDGALLNQPYDTTVVGKEYYGDEYNERLVKNSIGSTSQIIPKEFRKNKAKTLNDEPIGTKSAVGSTKVTKPTIKSFNR